MARIDGRCFTTLTKDKYQFEAPYDAKFRDMMIETAQHAMQCGFKINYAYTQSDEISLLFDSNETLFQCKERKLISILAAEASAKFSLLLGDTAAFDCRISQLPTRQLVVDYFRWRHEDAHRNALNAHCYWCLRKDGTSARQVSETLAKKSSAEKNELLFQNGINFNDLPKWHKRGIGLYWEEYCKNGINQLNGESVIAK